MSDNSKYELFNELCDEGIFDSRCKITKDEMALRNSLDSIKENYQRVDPNFDAGEYGMGSC